MINNLNDFWYETTYEECDYQCAPLTEEIIKEVENDLGYKLPESYISFMTPQNGGIPKKSCCPTDVPTSWAEDHVAIAGFLGIGNEKDNSLCGRFGSKFWIEEWEYPNIGIAICDCPSAGHDMIFLDYQECGPQGEPKVIHIDQEMDYETTILADNFEDFINKLLPEEAFEVEDTEAAVPENNIFSSIKNLFRK